MKKQIVFLTTMMVGAACVAQQPVGRVISSIPTRQLVNVAQEVCGVEQVVTSRSLTGVGAVLGAVAGGVLGYSVSHRSNSRGAISTAGALGGAVIGNSIEAQNSAPDVQNVQRCQTQYVQQEQTVYEVIYEFGGRTYSSRVNDPPGDYIPLQWAGTQAYPAQAPAVVPQQVIAAAAPDAVVVASPAVVYSSSPQVVYVAPTYAAGYYVAPVSVNLGYYWSNGRWLHGDRGWGWRDGRSHYHARPPMHVQHRPWRQHGGGRR